MLNRLSRSVDTILDKGIAEIMFTLSACLEYLMHGSFMSVIAEK